MVDGVRWDYIDRDPELKGFPRMQTNGVKAEYVKPIYPSNSYPNWYSIVTGLYAEKHGFVQNYMYDQEKEDYFEMAPKPNASHEHWWNKAQPLWITAEKNGIKTAMYWWDGCQVSISGIKPSVCKPYQSKFNTTELKPDAEGLKDVLSWFEKSKDNGLALVYYEKVDSVGHSWGPNSDQVKKAVREIDNIINIFQNELESSGMVDKVNFVIVSDHGMADSNPENTVIIKLEEHNVVQDIKLMLDKGSATMILPIEGKENELYDRLKSANIKGLHVYKKADIPDYFHLKNNKLVLPILLVADEGYYIQKLDDDTKMNPTSNKTFMGFHGYDPDKASNMRTIFYARGPTLKKGFLSKPIGMVDHYELFCRLLQINPLPNNGSKNLMEDFIINSAMKAVSSAFWVLQILCLLFTFGVNSKQ